MGSIKNKQEMIDYCKQQMEHYFKAMQDCTDSSYLRYYQGRVVAVNEMLANLGYDAKINISVVEMDD